MSVSVITIANNGPVKFYNNEIKDYYEIYNNILSMYEKEEVVESEIQDHCVVCLQDFDEREITILEKCEHVFHKTCVETWADKNSGDFFTCPLCREKYDSIKVDVPDVQTVVSQPEEQRPENLVKEVIALKIIVAIVFIITMVSIFVVTK